MKIGIDVSQLAFSKTGVAEYLSNLVEGILKLDKKNEYVLFFFSLRKEFPIKDYDFLKGNPKIQIKIFKIPPTILSLIWNRFHIAPIEWFVGDVDLYITSDWTEPPARKAKKATIIYDLIIYKYPDETHNRAEFNIFGLKISPNIVASQQRKLKWVKKESDLIFTISEASKRDIVELLGVDGSRVKVIYPGIV